jgi:hypothetical protein
LNREDGVENNLIMDSDSLTTSKIAEYIEEEINEANSKEKRVKVSLEQDSKRDGLGVEDSVKQTSKALEADLIVQVVHGREFKITEAQKILDTRFTGRIQAQKLEQCQSPTQFPSKKRNFEGTNLSDQNSFAALGNSDIVDLASGMGVVITCDHFNKVQLLKDIELAQHALQNVKFVDAPVKEMECEESEEVQPDDVPLLEWLDDDEENEQYTLVQSRKKKKKALRTQVELPVGEIPIRRTSRTTSSLYRRGQEQQHPTPRKKTKQRK